MEEADFEDPLFEDELKEAMQVGRIRLQTERMEVANLGVRIHEVTNVWLGP